MNVLNQLPTRWPRTFTVLGIGAVGHYLALSVLVEWKVRNTASKLREGLVQALQTESPADLSSEISEQIQRVEGLNTGEFLASFFEETNEFMLVPIVLGILLSSYFIGEVLLGVFNQLFQNSHQTRRAWAQRTARVAFFNQGTLISGFERLQTSVDAIVGFGAVIILTLVTGILDAALGFEWLKLVFYSVLLIVTPHMISILITQLGQDMDGQLDEYANLLKSKDAPTQYRRNTDVIPTSHKEGTSHGEL